MKQFYYDKTMVNFGKGWDLHMFFVEEIIEAVISHKKVAKNVWLPWLQEPWFLVLFIVKLWLIFIREHGN